MNISEKRYYQLSLLIPVAVAVISLFLVMPSLESDVPDLITVILSGVALFSFGAFYYAGIPYAVLCLIIWYRSRNNALDMLKNDIKASPIFLAILLLFYEIILQILGVHKEALSLWAYLLPFVIIIGYLYVIIVVLMARLKFK